MFIQTAFAQSSIESAERGLGGLLTSFLGQVPVYLSAIVVFVISIIIANFLKKIVVYRVTSKAKQEINKEVLILIERSVYFSSVLIGVIIAFQIVGINIAALIGFLGLGLGFAFKDLLANFIAGVVILSQKKFHIGDSVKVNDIIGKIIEIETRTTQIQDFDGTIHIIPNAEMLTSVVQNFTVNSFRRISFPVSVHQKTDLQKTIQVATESVKNHTDVVPDPSVQVLVEQFGDSGINLDVRFWIESTATWPTVKSEVIKKLKEDFERNGITLSSPIQKLGLDKNDENIMKAFHVSKPSPQQGQ